MIYLNNAATTYPKPESVIKSMDKTMNSIPEQGGREASNEFDSLSLARRSIGKLCNCDHKNVVLCPSATYALNLIIHGLLDNSKNAHCLTTTIEHNSVIRPLTEIQGRHNLETTYFSLSKNGEGLYFDLEKFENEIKDNTELIIVNHASNVIGIVIPIEEISCLAREHNIPLVIDASQSIGSLEINMDKLAGEVYLAFAGHKGLYGPTGTGGFILKGKYFEPIIQGGTGVKSELLTQPNVLPHYYEAGTPNYPGFSGLAAGVEMVLDQTVASISEYKSKLVNQLVEGMEKIEGIKMFLPREKDFSTGVLSFRLNNYSTEEVGYFLKESFDIVCRAGLHCAPLIHKDLESAPDGTIRFSVSTFNSVSEIDLVINALDEICRS